MGNYFEHTTESKAICPVPPKARPAAVSGGMRHMEEAVRWRDVELCGLDVKKLW